MNRYHRDKKEVQFNTSGIEYHHRWMGLGIGDNLMPDTLLDSLRMRSVYYEAKDEEIAQCRAPLKNGKLCSRRDLHKCPFHGKIIPRDAVGKPLDPQSAPPDKEKEEIPLWEQIADDVRGNLGLDGEGGNGRKRKEKTVLEAELERCSKQRNTAKSRIMKKLASSSKRTEKDQRQDYELRVRDSKVFNWC
jgi:hypothetical protein